MQYVNMHSVLFVNRVFPPERGATGRCLSDLAARCAAAGWAVTVLTDGRGLADAPRGVRVVRTGGGLGDGRPRPRGYLGALARLGWRGIGLPRHDVVVTMTDPPLLALAGPMLAARHGAALVHWCHDLYPQLLPALGMAPPPALQTLLERRMARALRAHDATVAIGRCMADRLATAGVPDARIRVVPNWPDPAIRPLSVNAEAKRTLGLEGRFVVGYAGNFGLAHPLGAVMAAAARLAVAAPDVAFLMVGEGRAHAAVVAAARDLPNLVFLPFQPVERLSAVLGAADLHLAVMDPRAEGLLVPSKVAGARAAGRPCLFLGPPGSEAARMVAEPGCGLVLEPTDGAALAEAVLAYRDDPQRRALEGARALAAAGWDADAAARHFIAVLDAVVAMRFQRRSEVEPEGTAHG